MPWTCIHCFIKHHALKTYLGGGGVERCTRWRWMISFTPRSLYPREIAPGTGWNRRLGGPQSWSGRGGEEKKMFHSCHHRKLTPGHPARSLVSILTLVWGIFWYKRRFWKWFCFHPKRMVSYCVVVVYSAWRTNMETLNTRIKRSICGTVTKEDNKVLISWFVAPYS
jgi:hypothetical protein